jgi:hypothetical protein
LPFFSVRNEKNLFESCEKYLMKVQAKKDLWLRVRQRANCDGMTALSSNCVLKSVPSYASEPR